MSGSCVGSPCQFGCSPHGQDGFVCGCPHGYHRIGQGHCLNTITPPAYGGYDIEDPLSSSENSDRFISTEGCFSCKVIFSCTIALRCTLNAHFVIKTIYISVKGWSLQ